MRAPSASCANAAESIVAAGRVARAAAAVSGAEAEASRAAVPEWVEEHATAIHPKASAAVPSLRGCIIPPVPLANPFSGRSFRPRGSVQPFHHVAERLDALGIVDVLAECELVVLNVDDFPVEKDVP